MKYHEIEPTLKPVTLHKLSPKEYKLAKEKFVRDRNKNIKEMIEGSLIAELTITFLFRQRFSNQYAQKDDKIILTVKTIYKRLYDKN